MSKNKPCIIIKNVKSLGNRMCLTDCYSFTSTVASSFGLRHTHAMVSNGVSPSSSLPLGVVLKSMTPPSVRRRGGGHKNRTNGGNQDQQSSNVAVNRRLSRIVKNRMSAEAGLFTNKIVFICNLLCETSLCFPIGFENFPGAQAAIS